MAHEVARPNTSFGLYALSVRSHPFCAAKNGQLIRAAHFGRKKHKGPRLFRPPTSYANTCLTTFPCTSVRRK